MKKKIFTVAEIGVNHNGRIDLAIKNIRAAAKAGASAVKFQTFSTDEFLSNSKENYTYKTLRGKKTQNMYKMFKKLEIPENWYAILIAEARRNKVEFFSSVSDVQAARFLNKIGVRLIKIASSDLTNYPLLECVAKLGNKAIISTGMGDQDEIDKAVKIFKKYRTPFSLLHCVSMYPTLKSQTNLLRICRLKERYKNIEIGYSDHSLGTQACVIAVVLGATIIEKHFTLNKKLVGPDQAISADPKEFKKLIFRLQETLEILGKKTIEPSRLEKKNRISFRLSITSKNEIMKGDKLTLENLCLKRPGDGIHPKLIKKILGKKTKRNILKDEKIKLNDLIF
jgi:N,N'-diacetyllegionaminate synthase